MRQIATVANEREVTRLADYLLIRGIKTKIDPGENGWTVWAYDEDRVADARREVAEFLQNPGDPRYAAASDAARDVRVEAERKEERARRNVIDMRKRWSAPAGGRPLTLALIAVSVLVGIVTRLGEQREPVITKLSIASYWIQGGKVYWNELSDIRHGEVWRLVTPIFLHFSFFHLLFNMLWLIDLGSQIEFRMGTWRFGFLVLTIAAVSNWCQYEYGVFRDTGGPLFGGMSGVVFGLFGYFWMKGKFDPEFGVAFHPTTVMYMIGWMFLCMTGWVGPIANTAHVMGLVTGMVLGYAPLLWRRSV